MDQNELFKVLETSIRQKVEAEIRASLQAEGPGPEAQAQMLARLKDDYAQEKKTGGWRCVWPSSPKGIRSLPSSSWLAAGQAERGRGPQWNEVKQRLLELLDATVQLMHS